MDDLISIFGTYQSWKLNEDTWIINFMQGTQNMYLLEGRDKALLVDTGWGAGNLRPLVERLTSKPVEVLNTHGHLDHAGGNGEWESVWMLPGAVADLCTLENSPFDLSRLPHPDYEKRLISDGQVLDLGDRPIQLFDISAHSNGSVALLDQSRGLLLVGDELESAQVLMYETYDRGPPPRLCAGRAAESPSPPHAGAEETAPPVAHPSPGPQRCPHRPLLSGGLHRPHRAYLRRRRHH